MMQLKKLANLLPTYKYIGEKDPVIKNLEMDSRKIEPGSLFFCVPGFTVDGHNFAEQAVQMGAVALIVEKELPIDVPMIKVRDVKRAMAIMSANFYQLPSSKMHMIGVTGTNGKTTTTHLIHAILSDSEWDIGLIGTMYMKYKGKEIEVKNTTPESLVLQKELSKMVEEGVEAVTMEVSSHALELGRVHGIEFNIAVFTNLTQDHLDYHETMEKYGQAKGLLFSQLGSRYVTEGQNVAVLNIDDDYFDQLATMTAVPIITYGIDKEADFRAVDVDIHESGSDFILQVGSEEYPIHLQLSGRFSVYNALAAAATAYATGIPIPAISTSLAKITGVAGRFEKVIVDAPFQVIVDYAHTPDSLSNVLETIREFAKGKVSVIIGCGGNRDRSKRPKMAAIAENMADFVYLTSDNPRSENPRDIIQEMEYGMSQDNYMVIENRKDAIDKAIERAEDDEIILIAGKGHETYQIVGDETYEFDDKVKAIEAIKGRY